MKRFAWIFPAIVALFAVALFVHEASLRLPLALWGKMFLSSASLSMDEIILFYGIFPRAGVALVAGAALGLSGALLQQLLRNPIADPSTLGISAGAQLAIVVATLFFPEFLDGQRTFVALFGAGTAAAIVFALAARRAFEPVTMVVSGLLVGVTAAALSAALTLAQGEYLMSLVTWNGGSLSQQDWSVFQSLSIEFVIAAVLSALLLRPLLLLGLGDAGARSLGVNLVGIRFAVATVATALAGFVAAGVGLVSFVGLAAPALVRGMGIRRPAMVVAVSPVAGALLLFLCDGLVQFLASSAGETFPTGAVTALIGGPLLLWLLPRVRTADLHEKSALIPKPRVLRQSLPFLLLAGLTIVVLALAVARDGTSWMVLDLTQIRDLASLRWPRLLAASAAGGLLALTGAILQRMTGNAMASPEVIGVSGGAGLGFATALTFWPTGGALTQLGGAGAGALLVMVLMLAFASRRHLPADKLLLAGIAIGSLSSSVLAALMAIGDQRSWQILAWLGGSASTATAGTAMLLGGIALVGLVVSLFFTRWLTVLPLGAPVARSLGVSVPISRVVLLLICGMATGAASLLVGPLSFVGLIAPHIALRAGFVRAGDHMAASFVLGAIVMAFADFGARTATFPYELPLGLFAALVGAPYLIWLVARGER
ncbi:Fe(3+)-hydroxamate ABC transporter permease FhuB [Rhizobiales bacterium RZME27]|uniref:Fe(3+)-hydroxamate ABC transporter permease FhuB n=1 Tax=Endobacterium cereale TaxID=2663029 RepID=A0A6A8AD01_9HYPH|nr:Fe(3+)-hydroxamate ABC transporter permease FhuB [Endobacterium cereale]MEB2844196.1 Fe(3+)-hydroxamate ABC transporter permease FhuB [Endobacterium cereale]MQY48609.1 Fe(3+)-hydroxamate ABC transporter permease FhuB [Endobacterium cereale]